MKKAILPLFLTLFYISSFAQNDYKVSEDFPFGKANPIAPGQIKDYEPMIGLCNCLSTRRNQDGTWNESEDITWEWKYIMNGTAVQDETLKADGSHSGSIRQFITDSSRWYVHWYSSKTPSTKFPVWEGNKKEDRIILYKAQKAPNGTEGFYRLSFYALTRTGYKWIGEWVNKDETIVYPTWKIVCTRNAE